MSRVLVIGDTHCPAMHKKYIPFLKKVQKKWKANHVVHIGDVIDHHCISFHEKHPDNEGAKREYDLTIKQVAQLYKAFPVVDVCIGNHDARVHRLSSKVGIPPMYIRRFNDLYATHDWDWFQTFEIDGVHYSHGEGCGGATPAFSAAKLRLHNTVGGHYHSTAGVWYQAGPKHRIFGMNVGCGVDRTHWSMQYGANYLKKPIVSCAVVIDGDPYLEVMDL